MKWISNPLFKKSGAKSNEKSKEIFKEKSK